MKQTAAGRVTEQHRDLNKLNVSGDQERRGRVSQIMKTSQLDLRLDSFQERMEHPQDVPRTQSRANGHAAALALATGPVRGEHEIGLDPAPAGLQALFPLARAVRLQRRDADVWLSETASAV
jgi:hypothetical protein